MNRLFIDWENIETVNAEGAVIKYTAHLHREAIHNADSYDALEAMVDVLEGSLLSEELVSRIEALVDEAREGVLGGYVAADALP